MTPLLIVLIAAAIATYLYGPWRLFKRLCVTKLPKQLIVLPTEELKQ